MVLIENWTFVEVTQIESAVLELELVGVGGEAAERSKAALAGRLVALGARVPITMTEDAAGVRLRALLPGPRAADLAFHLENMVSTTNNNNNAEYPSLLLLYIRCGYISLCNNMLPLLLLGLRIRNKTVEEISLKPN